MDFYRANEKDLELIKNKNCYNHNTALIAKSGSTIVGILEYEIHKMVEAHIINLEILTTKNQNMILKGLIDELLYWNSYIKKIIITTSDALFENKLFDENTFIKEDNWVYYNPNAFDIFKIRIDKIIPEQLTVDEKKVCKVSTWITTPEDVIITCTNIDNMIITIDGYSRLIAAYNKGFDYVYAYIDPDSSNFAFYQTCLKWCKNENVLSIKDLAGRIVSSESHQKQWIDRCQAYLKEQN